MAEQKKGSGKSAGSSKPKAGPKTEEREVKSEDLLDEVKKLIKEGNVQRIIVKNKEGKELLNLPIAAGLFVVIFLPIAALIATVVGLASEFTLVIERRE
jgi:hypothetical protein